MLGRLATEALDRHITGNYGEDQFRNNDGDGIEKLFDVTCVIGSVYADPGMPFTPTGAAFQLIAEHDAPGVYEFPVESGGLIRVTVEHEKVPS